MSPTKTTTPESSSSTESSPDRAYLDNNSRFWDLRGVKWRTDLGVLPCSSSVDDVRRVTANSRRSYATLRRRLLIDPLIPKDGSNFPDVVIDNPLSQDPDSMWGRFFQKAELEKMVDQDLSRLYPEHGSYFQTPGCQGVLRRILLLWCIRHPNYGYRQGMHELLAPLLYVLQADVERLSAVRKLYEHYFTDNFDGLSFHETDSSYKSDLKQVSQQDDSGIEEHQLKINDISDLDPKIQTIISFSDAYGAEGELGIVLSQKFMEHDAYCMFDALMSGASGAVALANFFSPSSSQNGLPPVIEASSALYHLLAAVDSSLHTHLVELGVEPQYFALRWLRVLFGREFALEDLLVIWDVIFSFDNSRLASVSENDPEIGSIVLNSSRGAFIAALAVSMILYIRSPILATETATSCLQRLLNFPPDVNLGKLLKKAESLVPLSIETIRSMPTPMHSDGGNKFSGVRRLSSDGAGGGTPLSASYWEEKWRVLHKEEEKKQANSPKQVPNRNRWSEKLKFSLLRTESDPSSSKAYREKGGPSTRVRRNLLDDLAQQLGLEDEAKKTGDEVDCKTGNGGSEESSSIFSDPPSPMNGGNDVDHENDTERSSIASNSSVVENEPEPSAAAMPSNEIQEIDSPGTVAESEVESSGVVLETVSPSKTEESSDEIQEVAPEEPEMSNHIQEDASPLPVPDASEDKVLKPEQNEDSTGKSGPKLKDRILSSGKFQWLWKLGKNGGEGLVEKGGGGGGGVSNSANPSVLGRDRKTEAAEVSNGEESINQNKTCCLKNLGQSMVENLQVIESVFQEEKGDNSSKKALVDRGQSTAMAALKELRKISHILSEM